MKTIKPFEVKISENHPDKPQTWRVFLDREFTAKLRVIKKDSDTKQTVLVPNAEFKIFNLDKNEYVTQYTTYPSKVKHTSFFTDEDGDLILPEALKIGNYRIEEVKAPFGYVVNDNYINISVDTDTAFETDGDTNDAIITVEYSDAPAVGELTVEKKGEVLTDLRADFLQTLRIRSLSIKRALLPEQYSRCMQRKIFSQQTTRRTQMATVQSITARATLWQLLQQEKMERQ